MGNMSADEKTFIRKQRGSFGAVAFGSKMLSFLTAAGMMSYMMENTEISGDAARAIMVIGLAGAFFAAFILSLVIDRTRKKSGRSKPWIYTGIVLVAASTLMSLHVPRAAVGIETVYVGIIFFVWCFGMKLLLFPADALLAGMTKNAAERTNLASVKGVAGGMAVICTGFIVGSFTAPGLQGGDGGRKYVLVFTAVILASMLLGSIFLRETYLPPVPDSQKMSIKECGEDLKAFFKDRYFLLLLLYGGMLMFAVSVFSFLKGEYAYWVLGEPANADFVKAVTYGVPPAAYLAVPFLTGKMTKRQCALLGTTVYGAACILMLVSLKMRPAYYPALVMEGIGSGFMWAMLWAMEPDVFDHVDHFTGRARAVFPVTVISAVIAVGASLASVVRQNLAALAVNPGKLAETAAQMAGRKPFIALGFILIPLAVCGGLAVVLRFYRLDEEYPEIRVGLDRRYKENLRPLR